MSVSDGIVASSFGPQKTIYSDKIYFQDEGGDYTVESSGIYKEDYSFTDSITQQQIITSGPTLWIERPTVVPINQNTRIKVELKNGPRYFRVTEIHKDVDESAYNLILHDLAAPSEDEDSDGN